MALYDDEEVPARGHMDDEEPPAKKKSMGLYDDEDLIPTSSSEAIKSPVNGKTEPVIEEFSVKEQALISVVAAKKGEREDMQDSHILDSNYCLHKKFLKRTCLFAIFDGHGGPRAAQYCQKHLPGRLMTKLSSFTDQVSMEKSLKKTITQVYKELDDAFLVEARKVKPVWKDGTTATIVIVLNDSIFVANVGDSKAIVARFKEGAPVPVVLTVDHNPTIYEERMRIQATGATVVNGRVNGTLEVSRSIGDGQYKTYGVTSIPDMRKCTITDEDKFLILACDGLWKVFSDLDAIQFVQQVLEEPADKTWSGTDVEELLWQRTANRLAAEAVRRKCGDNVSVILVRLSKLPSL